MRYEWRAVQTSKAKVRGKLGGAQQRDIDNRDHFPHKESCLSPGLFNAAAVLPRAAGCLHSMLETMSIVTTQSLGLDETSKAATEDLKKAKKEIITQ